MAYEEKPRFLSEHPSDYYTNLANMVSVWDRFKIAYLAEKQDLLKEVEYYIGNKDIVQIEKIQKLTLSEFLELQINFYRANKPVKE